MKIYRIVMTPLALAVTAAFSLQAMAEEAKPAAPAPAPAAKPAEGAKAGKPAAPKTEVKAEVTGKVELKKRMNKKAGKEVEVAVITVATAKAADGKALDELKGKTLALQGKKGANVKSYAGKDVTVNGNIINNRRLVVETIK